MLIFKFDNSDLNEDLQRIYPSIELKWPDFSGATIDEMMENFKQFLMAMTYSEKTIGDYLGEEDEEPFDGRFQKAEITNPGWVLIENRWCKIQVNDNKLYVNGILIKGSEEDETAEPDFEDDQKEKGSPQS